MYQVLQEYLPSYLAPFNGCGDEPPSLYYMITGFVTRPFSNEFEMTRSFVKVLASFVSQFHAIPSASLPLLLCNNSFVKRLHKQGAKLVSFHTEAGVFSPELIQQMQDKHKPVLVHADLHKDHVFFDSSSQQLKVIDFGDAIVASPFMELVALHLGLLQGNKNLLVPFLHSYSGGTELLKDDNFSYLCMCYSLLHEFNVYAPFEAVLGQMTCLEQVETYFWSLPKLDEQTLS